MKKIFRFEDYKGNYVMHCKTIEDANEFCKLMHENERTWIKGKSYLVDNYWRRNKESTCYYFNEGVCGDLKFANKENYTILKWSDFKGEDNTKKEPIDNSNKIDKKLSKIEKLKCKIAKLEKEIDNLKREPHEDRELLNGKFVCISPCENTTKGVIYDFINGVGIYDNGYRKGLFENLEDLNNKSVAQFIEVINYEEDDEIYYTGKVIYVGRDNDWFTNGKIYKFINGVFECDNGSTTQSLAIIENIKTFKDVKRVISNDFIELRKKEDGWNEENI